MNGDPVKYAQLRAQVMASLQASPDIPLEAIWRDIESAIDRLCQEGAEVVDEQGRSFLDLSGLGRKKS